LSRILLGISPSRNCFRDGSLIDFFWRYLLGIPSGIIHLWKVNHRISDPRRWIEQFAFGVVVILEKAAGFFA